MSSGDKAPFTTTLTKSVKTALRKVAFDRDQPMGEIIEEGLAAIGITGDMDSKDQGSEKDSSRK